MLVILFLMGGLEEFGWRGVLQPNLQQHMSAVTASALVGFIWAGWHLPFFLPKAINSFFDLSFLPVYVATLVGSSIIIGSLYNATTGSIIPAWILHGFHNRRELFEATNEVTGTATVIVEVVDPLVYWLIALLFIARYGTSSLAPGN